MRHLRLACEEHAHRKTGADGVLSPVAKRWITAGVWVTLLLTSAAAAAGHSIPLSSWLPAAALGAPGL